MLPSVLKCKLQPLTCPSFFPHHLLSPPITFPPILQEALVRGTCINHSARNSDSPRAVTVRQTPECQFCRASLTQGRAAGPEGHGVPLAGRLRLPSLPEGSPQPPGEAASVRPGAGALVADQLYTWLLGPSHLVSKVAFGDVLSNESSLMRDENVPTCGCAFIQMDRGVSKEPQTWVWTENLSLRSCHREETFPQGTDGFLWRWRELWDGRRCIQRA